jgi:hypothetical protein
MVTFYKIAKKILLKIIILNSFQNLKRFSQILTKIAKVFKILYVIICGNNHTNGDKNTFHEVQWDLTGFMSWL